MDVDQQRSRIRGMFPPDDVVEKAAPQHGVGKHTDMVNVTRGGKTFTRKQVVGVKEKKVASPEIKQSDIDTVSTERLQRFAKYTSDKKLLSLVNAELSKRGIKARIPQWYDEINLKYGLTTLPVGVPKKDVEMNKLSDINSGWVLRWKDPKSGADKYSYTKEYDLNSSKVKFERVSKLAGSFLSDLSDKAKGLMLGGGVNSQDGAVLYIMAATGLRIGDIRHKNKTGNEGVTTLSVNSVSVEDGVVSFNFIGKSSKRNVAVVRDADLARVVSGYMVGKQPTDQLFESATRASVYNTYKESFGYKDNLLKDIRTMVACSTAVDYLYGSNPPPPLPEDNKEARKVVADMLKSCFIAVSAKLNNTPKMAEKSYVNPAIINHWMDRIGGNHIMKSLSEVDTIPTLAEIFLSDTNNLVSPSLTKELYELDESIDDETYYMPVWMSELLSEFP